MNMCELRGGSCGRVEAAGSERRGHSGGGSPVSTALPVPGACWDRGQGHRIRQGWRTRPLGQECWGLGVSPHLALKAGRTAPRASH